MSKPNTASTSQTQHTATGFDPLQSWNRMAQENIARVQALYDELAAWEAKAYDRAKQTADQLADLANESMAYATKLAAEWRAVTLETTRKAADMARGVGTAAGPV